MKFYSSIAHIYDLIFPLSPLQVSFVNDSFIDKRNIDLLDVGCGTGSLTLAIANNYKSIIGIDLDNEMLSLAKIKLNIENVKFK